MKDNSKVSAVDTWVDVVMPLCDSGLGCREVWTSDHW